MIELFWLRGAFVGLADATQRKAWSMHTLLELLQVYFLGGTGHACCLGFTTVLL